MAMICGNCGATNDHPTFSCRQPKRVSVIEPTVTAGSASVTPLVLPAKVEAAETLAPPGRCAWCDRRRAKARDAMRKKRAG